MICEHCNNSEATFHYTEIVNNNFKEIHLCNDCAKKKNFFNSPINFIESQIPEMKKNNETANLSSKKEKLSRSHDSNLKCKKCGLTFLEFSKRGKFGCEQCYIYFAEELKPLISRIHNSSQHIGKRPVNDKSVSTTENYEKMKQLKAELQLAITNEEYEKAILIRDEIKKL